MQIRRFIVTLLAASLAVVGIAGCSSKEGSQKDNEGAMGRYVEKQIELPLKEGENAVGLVEGEEADASLITHNPADGAYKAYRYDGKAFEEEDCAWLNDAGDSIGELNKVIRGEDGILYALFSDDEAKFHVIKDLGDGKGQEINIPELSESDEMGMFPFSRTLDVDKDGNIFLGFPITGEASMYDQKTGDKIRSFQSSPLAGLIDMLMDVRDGKILLDSGDGSGLISYSTASGAEEEKIKYEDLDAGGIIKMGDNNDCIYADSKGIHHLTMGGSVSEELIGQNASGFGNPQSGIVDLVQTKKGEYTVLFNTQSASGKADYQLNHYVYDKTVKAKPSQTLTVYGLKESSAVRQAIANFQQKNPDVGVEYRTGNAEEGTGTKADSIRALNTELLGGSGADVIMLDGLPVDSYIEKGVLGDLSGVLKAAEKESGLAGNIIEPYKQDGEIYQLPTRFGIPILLGSREKTDILKSSEDLVDYMETHQWDDIFEAADKDILMGLLTNIYYQDIVDCIQNSNTELLADLIEAVGKGEKANEGTDEDTNTFVSGGVQEQSRPDWIAGKISGTEENDTAFTQEMKGIQGMMMPYHFLRKSNTAPTDVNGIYIPHDIAGINKASKNMELAEEFVKELLSEEVQAIDVESGFPVNEKAMATWIQGVEENPDENGSSISQVASESKADGDGAEPSVEIIGLPLRSEVQSLSELGRKLTVPVQKDDIIGEMILNGAKMYFEGSKTAEEAADDIAQKADTYLSE